jgi:hypothetical protein
VHPAACISGLVANPLLAAALRAELTFAASLPPERSARPPGRGRCAARLPGWQPTLAAALTRLRRWCTGGQTRWRRRRAPASCPCCLTPPRSGTRWWSGGGRRWRAPASCTTTALPTTASNATSCRRRRASALPCPGTLGTPRAMRPSPTHRSDHHVCALLTHPLCRLCRPPRPALSAPPLPPLHRRRRRGDGRACAVVRRNCHSLPMCRPRCAPLFQLPLPTDTTCLRTFMLRPQHYPLARFCHECISMEPAPGSQKDVHPKGQRSPRQLPSPSRGPLRVLRGVAWWLGARTLAWNSPCAVLKIKTRQAAPVPSGAPAGHQARHGVRQQPEAQGPHALAASPTWRHMLDWR